MGKSFRILLVSLASVLLLTACSKNSSTAIAPASPRSPAPTEIVKQILGTTDPSIAKGQELYLYSVVIPAGQAIPPHTHPGPQLGHIERGTLTYTVLDGSVTVVRAAGTPDETKETLTAPATTELKPGDTVIEGAGMIHEASNKGRTPVHVLLSSLFPIGAELSSPVPMPSPSVVMPPEPSPTI